MPDDSGIPLPFDVLSFGEVLVDWVSTAPADSLVAASAFEKAPGGAPANVAVALARLGVRVGFAGGLSPDPFGRWLRATLEGYGVDLANAVEIEETQTRMAYVLRTLAGDRELATFSTVGVADAAFSPAHAAALPYSSVTVFHFGGVTPASTPSDAATSEAVARARAASCLVSFDPNLRLPLWRSEEQARAALARLASCADILKVSDDEACFLTAERDPERAAAALLERFSPSIVAVTLGDRGAVLRTSSATLWHEGFRVSCCDATGAGDAFVAGLLRAVVDEVKDAPRERRRDALDAASESRLSRALGHACALGALATTRVGAMSALPTALELETFLAGDNR